ncbi:MAG: hypothetical protein ISR69_10230, partial [Gammaproteobacteria bacterium]|nr:hypothetical protein [Gammaproteobacteria bacterium]
GRKETGGRAALPAWVDYMRLAFDGMVVNTEDEPQGMVTVRIDEKTGERVTSGTTASRFEIFRKGHEPAELAKLIERNGPLVTETELEEQSESLF